MQTACARLRLPWHDLAVLSLHGRDNWLPLAHALLTRRPLCVYTDAAHTPAAIARFLLERGADWYSMAVASRLNDEDLDLVAAVFVQLGDTLATIAAQRARCRPEK